MKRLACLSVAVGLVLVRMAGADDGTRELTYEQDVRPILKAHCFQCHGEAGERESGLDVRLRRLLVQGGDSGAALVPGRPDDSLIVQRVRAGEMPPGDKKLAPAEIETLVKWVAAGAPTARPEPEQLGDGPLFTDEERQFWSFQPIRRPSLPTVRHPELVRTPIDAFLLARLEQEGLSFSPEADRATLIRRAYFDLIGLPPTPDEVAAFVGNPAPDAYERLVDRLLASPHYGERWGRHWLDVAGYADSEGYSEQDTPREWAFRYRDYVVRRLNADVPFDRFVQEQLAGDEMLPPSRDNLTPEQIETLAATGFLRMAPDGTATGGVDQAVARNQAVADTLQIVSTSLLGMTVHCAQCHDHRYDPIPQTDYYRLRAVFEPALDWKNWKVPRARLVSLATDADRELARQIEAEAAEVDRERLRKTQEYIDRTLEEELAELPEDKRDALRTAYKTEKKDRTPEQTALLKEHPSVANIRAGSLYLYDRRRDVKANKLVAQRKQREPQLVAAARQRELEEVPESERPAVEAALKAVTEKRTTEQTALLEKYPGVAVTAATLGRFDPEGAAELKKLADEAAELRASKAADNLKRYTDRAAEIRARKPKEQFVRALTEPPGTVPATYLFYRGDHEQPKQQVSPGDLAVLSAVTDVEFPADDPALPTTGRRLALARHLTDGRHPLVARVAVNRLWLHHFGRGLVNTPADFGRLGDRPTHPELLDWLAAEFMGSAECGVRNAECKTAESDSSILHSALRTPHSSSAPHSWSLKHLHRLILLSAAYRQSSERRPDLEAVDPENRLYGRRSLRRLEAEIVRDAVLAVSGRLNPKMFGPPVPVMEDEVGQVVIGQENLDGERKPGKSIPLHGEEFRRSLYVQVRRSRPLAVLETFDAPIMSPNCECRNASTVASQSLTFMNAAFTLDFAGHFARRVADEAGTAPHGPVVRAWQLAFGHKPTAADVTAAEEFLARQREAFRAHTPKADAATVEHQALTSFCQALLSANAFLYVD